MWLDRQYHELVSGRSRGPMAFAMRSVLGGLSGPYAAFVNQRNVQFDRGHTSVEKVPAPVISVGNLTVGGTGKTPFVAWLARSLASRALAVTIISRGYGARPGQPNDEALELAAQLPGVPHLQNRNRAAAARQALAVNPRQVLLLDDAFQHRWLARDLDIVLLDALAPFGHDHLLPRGLLREPVESLARAQVVSLSRSNAIEAAQRSAIRQRVRGVAPHAAWVELVHRPVGLISSGGQRVPLASLRGCSIAGFCGLGSPQGFRHTLGECGFRVAHWLEFPDHCSYGERDLCLLERSLAKANDVEAVVCSRKDLVKIPREEIGGKRLLALEIQLAIVAGESELATLLDQAVARCAAA